MAESTALARVKEELIKVKARATAAKAKTEEALNDFRRDATAIGGAYAFGAYKKAHGQAGTTPPSLLGLSPELTVVGVLYGAGFFLDGAAGETAHDLALGIACGIAMDKGEQ